MTIASVQRPIPFVVYQVIYNALVRRPVVRVLTIDMGAGIVSVSAEVIVDDLSTGQKMSLNLLYDIKHFELMASLSDQNDVVELRS